MFDHCCPAIDLRESGGRLWRPVRIPRKRPLSFRVFEIEKSLAKINSTLYVANYDQELKKMRIYCLGLAGRDSSEKASLNVASVCSVERSDV